MRRTIRRARDGSFQLRLTDDERDLVVDLATQLRELLVSEERDGLERLYPPAYANDPERDSEYRAMVHDELLQKRLEAVDVVEQTVAATSLTEEQVMAWMGAINDLRLVLGTRLDVTEDQDFPPLDDPSAPAFAVYQYLTHLLAEIVHALSRD
ncbi:MAG TPA: DUF2017 family protein [Acidimicrobiales bacterium]|jgi:hypothetical protein|nr:DUF2017 family protein [Acidimicrobiales bacterium]